MCIRDRRCPVETLEALDIDANEVEDVILTHLHYDHVGNFDRFPKARFHLQERELAYATGRFMRYPRLSHSFEVEDVCGIVRLNYARRVLFYDGDAELAPGIERDSLAADRGQIAERRRDRSGASRGDRQGEGRDGELRRPSRQVRAITHGTRP